MLAVLWIVLSLLAVLFVLAIGVLAMPVRLGFIIRSVPEWRVKVIARLFGGLIPPIAIHDSAWPSRKMKRHKTPAPKAEAATRGPRRWSPNITRAATAGPRLMADLFGLIHLEHLEVDADLGLADPADTGQLFGVLAALNQSLWPNSRVSIAVRPDFSGPRADGSLDAVLSLVPLALVPPGVRFGWRVFGPQR